jgi:hypothetical protein
MDHADDRPSHNPRIDEEFLSDVRLSIVHPNRGAIPARLLSLGSHRAEVILPSEKAPVFGLGQPLSVEVQFGGSQETFSVPAMVQSRVDLPVGRRYELHLSWNDFWHAVPARMRAQCDQRRQDRLTLSESDRLPIVLTIPSLRRAMAGNIADVSSRGIGVLVPSTADRVACQVAQLNLSWTIPGFYDPVRIRGSICHRRLAPNGLLYGVALEMGQMQRLAGIEQDLQEFIRQSRSKTPTLPA